MEPMTALNKEYFKRKNLVELTRIIATNYTSNQQQLPFTQKHYGLARQVFVKKICETVQSYCLTFDYISSIKKFYKSNSGENELEEIIDLDFLEKIDLDFMIVE